MLELSELKESEASRDSQRQVGAHSLIEDSRESIRRLSRSRLAAKLNRTILLKDLRLDVQTLCHAGGIGKLNAIMVRIGVHRGETKEINAQK